MTRSVLALVHGLEDASVRYRVRAYFPYLESLGWLCRAVEIPRGWRSRRALFDTLPRYDVVWLQRKLFALLDGLALRRGARRLIYDFDDALFIKDTRGGSRPSWTRRRRFDRIVRAADGVWAGNGYLAEAVRARGCRAEVVPTVVDTERYDACAPQRAGGERLRAVWIGSHVTLFYLEAILPALATALSPERFELAVISDHFPVAPPSLRLVPLGWSEGSEIASLKTADVGLMPLCDDAWSRGKCALKLVQYMAAGLPVVCSPVGTNLDLVRDGIDGFHAATPADWGRALSRLADDSELRLRMGRCARERVGAGWSLQSQRERVAALLGEGT